MNINSYKASFDSAVKRAEALPVKQETPDVPGTPSDNTPVNPDNYTDATAVAYRDTGTGSSVIISNCLSEKGLRSIAYDS